MRTPIPYPTGDLRTWAEALVGFLQNRDDVETETVPKPVSLTHKIDDTARAVTDGVLMYDPSLGKALVSISGAWVPIALDIAVTQRAVMNSLVLQDTYAPVTYSSIDPPTAMLPYGTYQVILDVRLTGTGGGGTYQFKFTQGGIDLREGLEYFIGNGETTRETLTFFINDESDDPVVLEARGNNCTLNDGVLSQLRIGQ